MHTVGREYVARHHVSIAKLMDYLPRSNDPACAAGYAHGLVTGIAPQIEAAGGAKAAVICKTATTRMQRYSCVHGFGHAFMRLNGDEIQPALELCSQLGAASAPDCAQGAFHDYWFAAKGLDDAPSQPAVAAEGAVREGRGRVRAAVLVSGVHRVRQAGDAGLVAGGHRRAVRGALRAPAPGLRDGRGHDRPGRSARRAGHLHRRRARRRALAASAGRR